MSINIYWSMLNDEWIRAEDPVSIIKKYYSSPISKDNSMVYCPAVKKSIKNVYGLKSIYDFKLIYDGDTLKSFDYDQNFFNQYVTFRNVENRLISFGMNYIFFAEKEIEMEAYIHPFLEENDFNKKVYFIPGSFDISKWFRPIECPFFLKKEYNDVSFKRDEIYTYIKFCTNENIKFKKFYPTDKIKNFVSSTLNSTRGIKWGCPVHDLNDFYKLFSFRKQLIKEIKNNLI